ncbi:MAG: DUF554 domain-containing protein [Clostridiales bacterium]|nr:DUF554 domain-containing protein [Clostridiales bacterium]
MIGLGTIINVIAILIGGAIGLLCGKRLPENCQETLTKIMGICVIFIGIAGAVEKMLIIQSGELATQGTLMFIISLALGGLIGELLRIDKQLDKFGLWLRKKSGNEKDNQFLDAFITSTMTVCIGAMAIVGAIEDGLYGDYTILAAKALLDLIIILVMASSMGKGCLFSAIPVAILQGCVTILARFMEPLMTIPAQANLSMVGSVLIFCVGLNLLWKGTIKVANLLPALVVAVVWALIQY